MTGKLMAIKKFIDQHPLAGRHKIKAYSRFIIWQITQAISPSEKIVSYIGNTKLSVKKGMTGATGNIYTGLHDFSDMGFLLHFLRKGDLFFDIGANVGAYTVLSSGCAGAKTISCEPVPAVFGSLKKNIQINHLDALALAYNIGLGSAKSLLSFTSNHDTVNHVVLDGNNENEAEIIEVAVNMFDNLALKEGVPDLVKIDVEGFETQVLEGMTGSLQDKRLKSIIIELNGSGGRYGFDEKLIDLLLRSHQFFPYHYDPFTRNLVALEKPGKDNTIYIRDIEFAKERVANADKIKVFSENI
jgi:FkbM family methyltransferase